MARNGNSGNLLLACRPRAKEKNKHRLIRGGMATVWRAVKFFCGSGAMGLKEG